VAEFKERTPPREHMRCSLCGRLHKLVPGDLLAHYINNNHPLDVRIQAFNGYSSFDWSARRLSVEELIALRDVLISILERVDEQLDETT
jgi:hypothetical protein